MSKVVNQREGVFAAIQAVLAETGTEIHNNSLEMAKEDLQSVVMIVTHGLLAGTIEMRAESRAKYPDEKSMKKYTTGLVNDFFRKDKRVNGGTKYEAKNPGSRASDPVIKELNKLKTLHEGNDEVLASIDEEIATRQAAKTETKKIIINEELVPESLKRFIK